MVSLGGCRITDGPLASRREGGGLSARMFGGNGLCAHSGARHVLLCLYTVRATARRRKSLRLSLSRTRNREVIFAAGGSLLEVTAGGI